MTLAILTGDIVDSSALPPAALDNALYAIEAATQELSLWLPDNAATHFARRGGDSWQIACPEPRYALRAALFLQATVKALDTPVASRIAIAVGDGTIPSNNDLNAAHGPAFTQSGRALSALNGPATLSFAGGGAIEAATVLADYVALGWTQTQSRAAVLALAPAPPTQAAIAQVLRVSRQAVNQSLTAAGMPNLLIALHAFEQTGEDK